MAEDDFVDLYSEEDEDLEVYRNISDFEDKKIDFNNPYIPREGFEE